MLAFKRSKSTVKTTRDPQPIILIYQFFIHGNKQRYNEIKQCLKFNVANNNISKIILPNERIYTDQELGIKSDKIVQVDIKRRIRFSDIFELVDKMNLKGYIATCNADIFFNNTLSNLYVSGINNQKTVYTQLRFEYTDKNLLKCKIFGPRSDSQDVWIFHSKFNVPVEKRKIFNIKYGIGGCDNKVAFLFNLLGYNVKNDPFFIKCFHNHRTQIRDYMNKATIPRPHLFVVPYLNPHQDTEKWPLEYWTKRTGTDFTTYSNKETNFIDGKDMSNLINLIEYANANNKPFSLPLVSIHAANIVHLFKDFCKAGEDKNEHRQKLHVFNMQPSLQLLKSQGMSLDNIQKIQLFSLKYMDCIYNSPGSFHYGPGDIGCYSLSEPNNPFKIAPNVGPVIHRGLIDIARKGGRVVIHNAVLNLGDYIDKEIWCDKIQDKKILIISKHHKSIKQQIDKKIDFYGRPLFKNCSFVYSDVPNCDPDGDFVSTINNYVSGLGARLDEFDIAFIGETPYSFFILDFLHSSNKSAISAGKYMKLWFGLYTLDSLKESKDMISLYMNSNWVNITDTTKDNIENTIVEKNN